MLQTWSLFIVKLDDLLKSVAKQEVVLGLVFDLKVSFVEMNILRCSTSFGWSTLLSCSWLVSWWINDLLKIGLVL